MKFTPEQLVALITVMVTLAAAGGAAINKLLALFLSRLKSSQEFALKQPQAQVETQDSQIVNFGKTLGLSRLMLDELLNRDAQIGNLSTRLTVLDVSHSTLVAQHEVLLKDYFSLKENQAEAGKRIEELEKENRALKDKQALSDQRIASLETENKELSRLLNLERGLREQLQVQQDRTTESIIDQMGTK